MIMTMNLIDYFLLYQINDIAMKGLIAVTPLFEFQLFWNLESMQNYSVLNSTLNNL